MVYTIVTRRSCLRNESCPLFLLQQNNDEETLLELGNLFMDLAQLGSAEVAFNRVLSLNGQNADARHNLAATLLMAGRVEEGIEQSRAALRIQPKYMLAMHNLALAYISKKDFTRARFWLREAFDIAPDDFQLRQLQTRLRISAFWSMLKSLPRRLFRK